MTPLRPAERARSLERTLIREIVDSAPDDCVNLALGEPDLSTPPGIGLEGIRAIAAGFTSYTTTAGEPELREAIARRYAPFARGAEDVVVTVGSQEALFASVLALVDAGDEVLYPDPGYPAYPTIARLVGARPVSYPLRAERGFRLASEDVTSRLTSSTRLVILCSPSNPTGALIGRREMEALCLALAERGIAWLSDEIYSGLVYRDEMPAPWHHSGGGVVVSGLSKELAMTGWRLGWAVAPAPVAAKLVAVHQHLVTCAPSVSQRAATAALGEEGREARRRHLAIFRSRRDRMREELGRIPGIRFEPPEGAFYFFVDVSAFGASLDVSRRLIERRKVVTVPGVAFGPGGEGYLRISFAASEADITRGVRAVGEELEAIARGGS